MTISFTSPGPGQWALDRSHFPGGATPLAQWLMEQSAPAALRRVFAEVGVPAETLDVRFVNGFMYSRLRPLIAPDKPAKRLPPRPVLKLAGRLHPAFRRASRAAERSLRERPWRGVIERWNSTLMPELRDKNLALQSVELGSLDDSALAAHVHLLVSHVRSTYELHFWLHGYDLGPIGMMLADCQRWGIDALDVVPTLGGASPSTIEPIKQLAAMRSKVEAAGAHPRTLDELRLLVPEIDDYLETRRSMMVSRYDLDGRTLGEMPDVIVASVMTAEVRPPVSTDDLVRSIRARVPAAEQAGFDERFTEARAAMDLRDANGPMTAEWPVGLVRLAVLHAGARLVAAGRVNQAEHLFELEPSEFAPLIAHHEGPSVEELVARAHRRVELGSLTPPLLLGDHEPAPSLDVLPPSLARMVGAVQTVMQLLGMAGAEPAGGDGLAGHGIGTGRVSGRACKALSADEALGLMEPGDILVVPFTTPAYNMVLALAGGVITSEGGPLCHAAVLARELGIPAVVGASEALSSINHGDTVEVDADGGRVSVLLRRDWNIGYGA